MKNEYEIRGDIVAIKLKNRKGEEYETIIDLDDLEKVKSLNLSWSLKMDYKTDRRYCQASEYLGMINGKPKYRTVYLHSVIIDRYKQHIDHINHDSLDNRKCNLIDEMQQINLINRDGANKNSTTGVRNVSYDKTNKKYIVQLQVNGKNTVFGKFDNLNDAKKCAEENRNKYYGTVLQKRLTNK
jgi:hypothetical protein